MLVLAAFVKRTLADIAQVPGVVTTTLRIARGRHGLLVRPHGRHASCCTSTAASAIRAARSPPRFRSSTCWRRRVCRARSRISKPKLRAISRPVRRRSRRARGWRRSSRQSSASPDFLDRTLRAIAATTPADVQRVARIYLGNPDDRAGAAARRKPAELKALALVHDYLNQRGGAERVFAHIAQAWPEPRSTPHSTTSGSTGDLVARSARTHVVPCAHSVGQPLLSRARAALSARLRIVRLLRIRHDRQFDDRLGEGRASFHPVRCTSATSIPLAGLASHTTTTSAALTRGGAANAVAA